MEQTYRDMAVVGLLFAPVLLSSWFRSWGWVVGWLTAVVAVGGAAALGILPLDAPRIWIAAVPVEPALRLLPWLILMALARSLREPWGPGGLGAALSGLAFGGPTTSPSRDPKVRGRLALVSVVAGLASPIGNPVAWLLRDPSLSLRLLPLAALLLLVVFPFRIPSVPLSLAGPDRGALFLSAGALVAFALSWISLPEAGMAVALGVVGLEAIRSRSLDWRSLARGGAWALAVLAGLTALRASGILDVLGQSLYDGDLVLAETFPLLFALGAGIFGLLGGAAPVAVMASLLRDAQPVFLTPAHQLGLLVGAVIGGMWPVLSRFDTSGTWLLRGTCVIVALVWLYFG